MATPAVQSYRDYNLEQYGGLRKESIVGFGKDKKVYKVCDQYNNTFTVAKINLINDLVTLKVIKEIHFLGSATQCPQIASLLGYQFYFSQKKNIYRALLVMPLYQGTLEVCQSFLDPFQKFQVCFDVALGLRALHDQEIVFSDLNKTNIIVQPYLEGEEICFRGLLIDLGGSVKVGNHYINNDTNFRYGSPEALHHLCKVTYLKNGHTFSSYGLSHDVWSFALIYFETLWNQNFFEIDITRHASTQYTQYLQLADRLQQEIVLYPEYLIPSTEMLLNLYRHALLVFERMTAEFVSRLPDDLEGVLVKECLNLDPRNRPTIHDVLSRLETIRSL